MTGVDPFRPFVLTWANGSYRPVLAVRPDLGHRLLSTQTCP